MTTARHKPRLEPATKLIREAIAREGLTRVAVGNALGVTGQTVSGWVTAKARPRPEVARRLARLLKLDPDVLTPPAKPKPNSAIGPAQRAVALASQHIVIEPPRLAPAGVFGVEARADGTMTVWVKATLPYEKGVGFLRALLDFGLVKGEE